MIGKTLSHYKVLEKIGQGGMGEVYRAEDTNLSREVAIKVLPKQFTKDPQRLARFEREAKLLAQLNHPNIAAIHSFEHADDIHFLVLELVPGETLAERVAKGPLPVEEALEVCRQIAEGVETAHEKGVIHRDLKPANLKVTPEGKVKILDFGLAKAFEAEPPITDISQSPTLTEEMTRAGVILGTAAYMSPEQAKGKPVDKRADIFAFGAVLYELLTGKRAFGGETITETIAAVLKSEPDWEKLPGDTPWRIRELLDDSLQKEVRDRPHDISHARIQINKALKEPATTFPIGLSSGVQPPSWRKAVPWSIAAVALVIAGVAVWNLTPSSIPASLTSFALNLSSGERLTTLGHEVMALSPDGTRLVYGFTNDQLYLREMEQLESQPIPGTQGAEAPFFSPDGQWVGFTAGALKKVSLTGGSPVTLSDDVNIHGASWGADDTIIFAPNSGNRGLFRISAAGRDPVALTTPDPNKGETAHSWPQILPGGQAVLFTVWTGGIWDDARIVVEQIEERERRVLIEGGTHARYVPTGHLVYSRASTLLAVPFDLARLEVTGSPVPVVEGVWQGAVGGVAQFAFSDLGSLVYVPGSNAEYGRTLVLVNRQGTVESLEAPPRAYQDVRLSPDGQRLAVHIEAPGSDLWTYDIPRKTLTRLTFEGRNNAPTWTPDGKWVTFESDRAERPGNLFWKPADGSGMADQLTTSEQRQIPHSWSPDGKLLAFSEVHPTSNGDIWVLPLEGEREPQLFLQTPFNETMPVFSPDGHWLAYRSDESGRYEVYVQPYPGPGGKWQISTEGGNEPLWARNGGELFYRNGEQLMAVDITTQPGFSAGTPHLLFEGQYHFQPGASLSNYDVTPDGQRFIMIKSDAQEARQINVVLNWFEELKRLVPTN